MLNSTVEDINENTGVQNPRGRRFMIMKYSFEKDIVVYSAQFSYVCMQ